MLCIAADVTGQDFGIMPLVCGRRERSVRQGIFLMLTWRGSFSAHIDRCLGSLSARLGDKGSRLCLGERADRDHDQGNTQSNLREGHG